MKRRSSESLKLPDWIFDIDETDDPPRDVSILQELEIDIPLIMSTTVWMLLYPINLCIKYSGNTAILSSCPLSINVAKKEFWGPCCLVALYGLILRLGKLNSIPWVFIIWGAAAVVINLIARIFFINSSTTLHLAILGYSTASLPVIAITLLLFRPPHILAICIKVVGLLSGSACAIQAYQEVCTVNAGMSQKKRQLLILPVVLMHIYLISLIPT